MIGRPIGQPDDWTEPGAWPVRSGVHRIPLPVPTAAVGTINAYAIEDARGLVLVDPGWAHRDTEAALTSALRGLGYGLADVSQILVTHAHKDHYTQAVALRGRYGTRVRIGRGEARSIREYESDARERLAAIATLRRSGAGELAEKMAELARASTESGVVIEAPDEWLDHGERVTLGERTLDVLATPGHTQGHTVFRDAPAGLLFAGDHVLPRIVPTLGVELPAPPDPLGDFLASLELLRDLPDTTLLPAHGPVRPSTHRRVDELLAYHHERLSAAATEVRAGRSTAFEVAAALRWTRHARKLADLNPLTQMLAVRETAAQLALLVNRGDLIALETADVETYAVAQAVS